MRNRFLLKLARPHSIHSSVILQMLAYTPEMARADILLALRLNDGWIREQKIEALLEGRKLVCVIRRGTSHAIYYRSLLWERL